VTTSRSVAERLAALNPVAGREAAQAAIDALCDDHDALPLVERFSVPQETARVIVLAVGLGEDATTVLTYYLDGIGA
jgi:hypothetical protein